MIGAHARPRPRQPRAQRQMLVRSPSRSGSGPHSDRPSQCLTRHGGARTASLPNPHRVTRERAREQEETATVSQAAAISRVPPSHQARARERPPGPPAHARESARQAARSLESLRACDSMMRTVRCAAAASAGGGGSAGGRRKGGCCSIMG